MNIVNISSILNILDMSDLLSILNISNILAESLVGRSRSSRLSSLAQTGVATGLRPTATPGIIKREFLKNGGLFTFHAFFETSFFVVLWKRTYLPHWAEYRLTRLLPPLPLPQLLPPLQPAAGTSIEKARGPACAADRLDPAAASLRTKAARGPCLRSLRRHCSVAPNLPGRQ